MASVEASLVLSPHRVALLELYSHFSSPATTLPLAGWLAFTEAFDIAPGYLSVDRVEEAFEEAGRASGSGSPSSAVARGPSNGRTVHLSFSEFCDALCLLGKAIADKQWKVEFAAEKAARYRYKLKDATKSRVEPGPEERLEGLLGALDLHDARSWRRRAGLPPSPAAERVRPQQAHAQSQQQQQQQQRVGSGASGRSASAIDADFEEQLRSLRRALAVDPESPTGSSDGATGGGSEGWMEGMQSNAFSTTSYRSQRDAPSVPPTHGAGRTSRRSGAAAKRPSPPGASGSASAGGPYASHRPAGYSSASSGAHQPTPPSAPGGSSPRPGASTIGGRSPRRLRVAADQNPARGGGAGAAGGLAPTPPTTPRDRQPQAQGGRPASGSGGSGGASRSASGGGGGASGVWAAASVYISPRPSETSGQTPPKRHKESARTASSGGVAGSGGGGSTAGTPSPEPRASPPEMGREAAVGGGVSGGGGGGAGAQTVARTRLRESTNTRTTPTQAGHVAASGCPRDSAASPPTTQCRYYALSSRGGAAQPLTDTDFVTSLLTGGAVGGGRKPRAVSSAGGTRPAREVTAAYGKPRPASARTVMRSGVQAW